MNTVAITGAPPVLTTDGLATSFCSLFTTQAENFLDICAARSEPPTPQAGTTTSDPQTAAPDPDSSHLNSYWTKTPVAVPSNGKPTPKSATSNSSLTPSNPLVLVPTAVPLMAEPLDANSADSSTGKPDISGVAVATTSPPLEVLSPAQPIAAFRIPEAGPDQAAPSQTPDANSPTADFAIGENLPTQIFSSPAPETSPQAQYDKTTKEAEVRSTAQETQPAMVDRAPFQAPPAGVKNHFLPADPPILDVLAPPPPSTDFAVVDISGESRVAPASLPVAPSDLSSANDHSSSPGVENNLPMGVGDAPTTQFVSPILASFIPPQMGIGKNDPGNDASSLPTLRANSLEQSRYSQLSFTHANAPQTVEPQLRLLPEDVDQVISDTVSPGSSTSALTSAANPFLPSTATSASSNVPGPRPQPATTSNKHSNPDSSSPASSANASASSSNPTPVQVPPASAAQTISSDSSATALPVSPGHEVPDNVRSLDAGKVTADHPRQTPSNLPESPVRSGIVQMAQIVDRTTQSEMRIGLTTSAFGNVEVRTSVHANDVGIQIGSEKGDLRSMLANEIPNIAHNLQQQNLRLHQLDFQQGFGSFNSMSSGSQSQPRPFHSKAMSSAMSPLEPNHQVETNETVQAVPGLSSFSILA